MWLVTCHYLAKQYKSSSDRWQSRTKSVRLCHVGLAKQSSLAPKTCCLAGDVQSTPLTPQPQQASCASANFFFFSVTILQSLLKFKKDLKSGTPVVVGHDPVVCATVAIEPGTAARSKAREGSRKSWSLLEEPQPQGVAVGWLIFAERQFC